MKSIEVDFRLDLNDDEVIEIKLNIYFVLNFRENFIIPLKEYILNNRL